MKKQLRRRFTLPIAGVVAAFAMAFTSIVPASAHTVPRPAENLPPWGPTKKFGAIAVAHDGSMGQGLRKQSKARAEERALQLCGADTCKVVVSFTLCGAVAHDGAVYHGGAGHNRSVAENDAVARLGGGWVVHTACN